MKIILNVMALFLACGPLTAQTSKVPEAARAKFASQFPEANAVKWDYEDGNWEASFHQDNKAMSATFDEKGNLQETETDIVVADLPKAVSDYLSKNFPGRKIKEAAMIVKPDGTKWYEAEINGKDHLFDENGKPVQ